MTIISGQSNPQLATDLAHELNVPLAEVEFSRFPNGEQRLRILTPLADEYVLVVQSMSGDVDSCLMELLLLVDAADRAGARKIAVVLPWMAYSLQDKIFRNGEPLSARVLANVISNQHINRVFLFDLHNTSIVGFFSVPTSMISAQGLLIEYAKQNFSDVVVVSPDFGGLKRARSFAEALDAPLATIDKTRDRDTGEVKMHSVGGADFEGKTCVLIDDIISTGSTVMVGAEFLKSMGAKEVHMLATHGLFAGDAREKLSTSSIDSVIVTDSIHQASHPKIMVLSAAPTIAREITTLYKTKN